VVLWVLSSLVAQVRSECVDIYDVRVWMCVVVVLWSCRISVAKKWPGGQAVLVLLHHHHHRIIGWGSRFLASRESTGISIVDALS
jgi:hypothetical protein